MRRWLCPTLLLLVVLSNAAFNQLTDVFHVDIRDPKRHFSSCLQLKDPNDKTSVLFDPNAAGNNREHPLNTAWAWIQRLVPGIRDNIGSDAYEAFFDTRKLMRSFFAIKPSDSPEAWEPTDSHDVSTKRLSQVRDRFEEVDDLISRVQPNGPKKPMLFCDSTFAVDQTKDSYALDKNGKRIRKKNSLNYYKLGEWEQEHGRDPDDFWYFWVDFEGHYGYLVDVKHPGQSTLYPIDPRTNMQSGCLDPGTMGLTWVAEALPVVDTGGTDAWLRESLIMLCPASWHNSKYPDKPKLTEQPTGTHLDTMGFATMTFLHELFHVTQPTVRDFLPYFPKYYYGAQGRKIPEPSWPSKKIGFDTARRQGPGQSSGGLQSMTFAAYEAAAPETTDIDEMTSIHDPENLAWFALAMLLQASTGQDWSSGAARRGDSPETHPTASIPGFDRLQEIAAKTTSITSPLYDGSEVAEAWPFKWDDEWRNVTRQWRNTTEAMGPITSFDEFTTFVTSVRARL